MSTVFFIPYEKIPSTICSAATIVFEISMPKKQLKGVRRDLAQKELASLISIITNIDTVLSSDEFAAQAHDLLNSIFQKMSFAEAINWLPMLLEQGQSNNQDKIDKLVISLENEFEWPDMKRESINETEIVEKVFLRSKAYAVIKMFLDGPLILYGLGRIGPAIIELHSILERQAVLKLSSSVFLPTRAEIGQKILERLNLSELAPLLNECDVISKTDVKYAETLIRLRNGLAHRNPMRISNAVLSGQELREVEIDDVLAEIDFIPYITGAIHFLIKTFEWNEDKIDGNQNTG